MPSEVSAAVSERLARLASAVESAAANDVATVASPGSNGVGPPLHAAATSVSAAALAVGATPALPPQLSPSLDRLRYALLEFEDRLAGAGACWADQPLNALYRAWLSHVQKASQPVEIGAALVVLEACIAPCARSRWWGVERAGGWREEAGKAVTIAAVASCLSFLDEVGCAWDALAKRGEQPPSASGSKSPPLRGGKGPPRPPRERMSEAEFAHNRGSPLGIVSWCAHSPAPQTALRALLGGHLFQLTPCADGGWDAEHLSPAPAVDLHGLTVTEARGARVTAWYEEEGEEGYVRDVPYTGVVVDTSGCQSGKRGMVVRFDAAVDAKGNPEVLNIGNDDEWLYGLHYSKPERRF
jgi:hypothetical protein